MNKEAKRLRSVHDDCHYCGDAVYWAAALRIASVWTEGVVLPVLKCPRCGASNTAEIGSGVRGLSQEEFDKHQYTEACKCIWCSAMRQAADEDLLRALDKAEGRENRLKELGFEDPTTKDIARGKFGV